MKRGIVLAGLAMMTMSSCVKDLTARYQCHCTITMPTGTGNFVGAEESRPQAEQDCKEKIIREESQGNTADCEIKEVK